MTDPVGRWPLDVPFPALLTDRDLMAVIGLKSSQFYALKPLGEFRFLEVRPPLAHVRGTRYSGSLVTAWANGELGTSRYFRHTAESRPRLIRRQGQGAFR